MKMNRFAGLLAPCNPEINDSTARWSARQNRQRPCTRYHERHFAWL